MSVLCLANFITLQDVFALITACFWARGAARACTWDEDVVELRHQFVTKFSIALMEKTYHLRRQDKASIYSSMQHILTLLVLDIANLLLDVLCCSPQLLLRYPWSSQWPQPMQPPPHSHTASSGHFISLHVVLDAISHFGIAYKWQSTFDWFVRKTSSSKLALDSSVTLRNFLIRAVLRFTLASALRNSISVGGSASRLAWRSLRCSSSL